MVHKIKTSSSSSSKYIACTLLTLQLAPPCINPLTGEYKFAKAVLVNLYIISTNKVNINKIKRAISFCEKYYLLLTTLCTWHSHWEKSLWVPVWTGFALYKFPKFQVFNLNHLIVIEKTIKIIGKLKITFLHQVLVLKNNLKLA